MRRTNIIGISLVICSFAVFFICLSFLILVNPSNEGTTFAWDNSDPNIDLGVVIRLPGVAESGWYTWILSCSFGVIGIAYLIWESKRHGGRLGMRKRSSGQMPVS